MRAAVILLSLVAGIVPLVDAPAAATGQRGLVDLERRIAEEIPSARSLTAEQFEAKLAGGLPVVVLDVREPSEYEISRLPGARRVEPRISAREFMRRHGSELSGRVVLLYCSVGVRSSQLAARIDEAVRAAGATGAFNLSGGVFSWHNTGRKLIDTRGGTDAVHGYNSEWARFVDFDNLVRYGRGWGW